VSPSRATQFRPRGNGGHLRGQSQPPSSPGSPPRSLLSTGTACAHHGVMVMVWRVTHWAVGGFVLLGLGAVLFSLGLDRADKVASVLGALAGLAGRHGVSATAAHDMLLAHGKGQPCDPRRRIRVAYQYPTRLGRDGHIRLGRQLTSSTRPAAPARHLPAARTRPGNPSWRQAPGPQGSETPDRPGESRTARVPSTLTSVAVLVVQVFSPRPA
jgi:hypothetical protein